jgi:hypothetical protein
MRRLKGAGIIDAGARMLLVACVMTAGAACVGQPPVFAEPDGAPPDARDDDDATGTPDGTTGDGAGDDGPSDDATSRSDGGGDAPGRDSRDAGAPCDPSDPFIAIEPIAELNAASDEEGARLTPDELVMYFTRRVGAGQPYQIFTSKRATRDEPFGAAMPILLLANASGAMIAPDQMTLYYSSDRGGSDDNAHLYMAKIPFSATTSVALNALNSTALDYSPYVSADDTELYFVSRRPADIDDNIFAARREAGAFALPAAVAAVNSTSSERSPVVSADGLRLYIGSNRGKGADDFDIFVATRTQRDETFQAPVSVNELSTPSFEMPDWVAPDDCTLYFRSDRPGGPGGRDLWRARRR